jgi:sugar lactone lactonase YvrE
MNYRPAENRKQMMRIHAVRVLAIAASILCVASLRYAEVEFVVGDYMEAEGGSWTAEQSPLSNPFGIDFDSKGEMYVVELVGGRVHRIDSDKRVTRIAGDGSKSYAGDGGPADRATFNGMHNCAITRDDQLLIADSWNHCVRRIDLESGIVDTIIGTGEAGFSGDGGPARQATFDYVMCISLNADKSVLHITDLKNARIRNVDLVSGRVQTVAGNGSKGVPEDGSKAIDGPLVDPRAAASDGEGALYVLERNGHALRVVDPAGRIRTVAGTGKKGYRDGPALQAEFGAPKHLCVDETGNVYIADDLNGAVRRLQPNTARVETILGKGFGDERIRLLHPHGVCVRDGMLYVIDSGNNRILRMKLAE